jgi:phage shock protein PspC (stress-responsive transcriptional regulator)
MKQVININFHGRVVPIEVSAYEMLKAYIERLRVYFSKEDGGDEIINDIEGRISELFQERLKEGATCITDTHVQAVIQSIGNPEQFDEDIAGAEAAFKEHASGEQAQSQGKPATEQPTVKRLYRSETEKVIGGVCGGIAQYFGIDVVIVRVLFLALFFTGVGIIPYLILWIAVPSSSVNEIGGVKKKLYRDPDDKIIGGVCGGIGRYFNINAWIPRVMFLIPFLTFAFKWVSWGGLSFPNLVKFTFSPGAALFYIILWMVMPEASTTSEKLEMKGEKVDLESIKNSVMSELKSVKQRTEVETIPAIKKNSGQLGNFIRMLVKVFVYIILGIIGFTVLISLFAMAIAVIGIFPLKDLVLEGTWQNFYAWGTLIFFLLVPIVGIITWILRRIFKTKRGSGPITFVFTVMWIFGWICLTLLVSSIVKENKRYNIPVEEEMVLTNPTVDKLIITSPQAGQIYVKKKNWLTFEPFSTHAEDSVMLKNIKVQIVQSPNDSFKITMMKVATGRNTQVANVNAAQINFTGYQQDSLFYMNEWIAITKDQKFRNQRVYLTVYVPVGKSIQVDRSVNSFTGVQIDMIGTEDLDLEFKGVERGWRPNRTYIMGKDGLKTPDGAAVGYGASERPEKGSKRVIINENGIEIIEQHENGRYRYDTPETPSTPDVTTPVTDTMKISIKNAAHKKNRNTSLLQTIPTYNPFLKL